MVRYEYPYFCSSEYQSNIKKAEERKENVQNDFDEIQGLMKEITGILKLKFSCDKAACNYLLWLRTTPRAILYIYFKIQPFLLSKPLCILFYRAIV